LRGLVLLGSAVQYCAVQ